MTEAVFNKVVRRVLATTSEELKEVLGSLPHGTRFGVAQQLEETGEAHRYENLRHCAYYLVRHEHGVLVWRWCYIATQLEADRLRTTIASLKEPLDADVASRVFEHATFRSVRNPRPMTLPLYALDFGGFQANVGA